jgi:hypothetical protein
MRPALAILATVLLLAGCGGPVRQSYDLLGIAASPWPLRNQALVVFIKPGTDATEVAALSGAIAAHKGVAAWQYEAQMTDAQVRADLADVGPTSTAPTGPPVDLNPTPRELLLRFRRAFVVVARSGLIQLDLANWLSNSPIVSFVAYWTSWDGTESVVSGLTVPPAAGANGVP